MASQKFSNIGGWNLGTFFSTISHYGVSAGGASVSSSGVGTIGSRRNVASSVSSVQRRSNYRILSDMPDEDWGIPDICLQKTAEVSRY